MRLQILLLVYFDYITEMVFNVHEKADKVTGVKPDGRGEHYNHQRVSSENKENVLADVTSFSLVDSHFCKAKTNKTTETVDLISRKCMIFIKEIAEKMKAHSSNHLTTDSFLTHASTSDFIYIYLRQIDMSVVMR